MSSLALVTALTLSVGMMGASTSHAAKLDPIAPQLRAQVEKSRSQLGTLQPWQEEAFNNEVLPSAGRFVKDYSSRAGVLTRIEIDFEGIKRYLSFHSDQVLKSSRKAILAVRASESCTPCVGAVPSIRKDFKDRLELRGFEVIVLSAQESAQDLSELLSKKSAAGWVLAQIKNVEDREHPGEFRNELLLEFRFPGTPLTRVQKQMEILPNDSIEVSMSRMAVDGLSEMGNLVRQARIGSLEAEGAEGIEVAIQGMTAFTQLQELKKGLQAQLQSTRVVEKKLQRGHASLAIVGDVQPQEISRAIQSLQLAHAQVRVVSTSDQVIQITATPKGNSP